MLKRFFKILEKVSEEELKKGLRMYVWDGVCSMGMGTLQGGIYLTAFALAIGATQRQIGIIAGIGFFSQLMQLPGLFFVNRYPRRKIITVISASLARLFWLPIILLPFISKTDTSLLLLFLLLSTLIGSFPGPAWNSLLRDLLPQDRLGKINSRRLLYSTSMALILTLAGGYFISWWKINLPDNEFSSYSILFFLGLLFGLTGVTYILRMPEPLSTARKISFSGLLAAPLRDKNFRSLIIFLSIWNLAVNMSGPFFLVYMLNRIKISFFMVTVLVVTGQLTNISFLKIWGRLADRFSNKSVLSVSGPLFLVSVLMWTFTTTPDAHKFTWPLLFIIHILNGIAVAGVTVGTSNITLKQSPEGMAHSYMTVIGLATSVMGAIAPVAGGFFADALANVQVNIPLIITVGQDEFYMPIIDLKDLDFLFMFTFIIGLLSFHPLTLVKERGEVPKKVVIDELTDSIVLPLKSIALLAGIHKIAVMPLSGLLHLSAKIVPGKRKKLSKGE